MLSEDEYQVANRGKLKLEVNEFCMGQISIGSELLLRPKNEGGDDVRPSMASIFDLKNSNVGSNIMMGRGNIKWEQGLDEGILVCSTIVEGV
ncbi:hypothetical protein L6452_08730 [Arctium lappa]|uniref:Uncharacterized protein n=1 Tax=Arctium lappa TaxID=4217 RepID=A0ACB9DI07_ARCLA|nr:hypothetical protein L6452_08730 [Arctium lappa]